MTKDAPEFLDVDDVLELHQLQLARYGGADGVRDLGLLESAVAQPQSSPSAGRMSTTDCSQWPQRISSTSSAIMRSALVFLDLNGISIEQESEALYELTMGVAEGRIDKAAVAVELGRIAKKT